MTIYKYILYFSILCAFPLAAFTQEDTLSLKTTMYEKPLSLKISVLRLISPVLPSVHLTFEHPGQKEGRFWRHQAGTYVHYGSKDQEAIEQIQGVRLQTGLRKYKSKNSRTTSFKEISFDYRYLDLLIGGDFNRSRFNFRQRINYNMWQHSLSLNFILGQSIYISEHWHIDIATGLGVRLNHRTFSSVPKDASFNTNGSKLLWKYEFSDMPWRTTLSVPVVLAIGYAW